MQPARYMVVERYRNGDPTPVYRRLRQRGRLMPPGLVYVGSWVAKDLTCCYQLMESADRALLDTWMAAWQDLVDFDVLEVIPSEDAQERLRTQI